MPLRILHVCRCAEDPLRGDTLSALAGQRSLTQHTVQLGGATGAGRWSLAKLRSAARRFRPDVVHAWDADSAVAATLLTGRARRVVGLGADADLRRLPRTPALRWALRRADRVVLGAEAARRWALRAAPRLDPARLLVAPDAVRPTGALAAATRDEALARIAAPADARLIAIPAPLEAPCRVTELLWAADLLRVVCDEVRVLVLGAGPCRRDLIRFARLACDLEHIRFASPGADSAWLWPHVDLVWDAGRWLCPPRWLLEAHAAGVAMVGADAPGVQERWPDGAGFSSAAVGVHERADRIRATVAALACQAPPWRPRGEQSVQTLEAAATRLTELYHRAAEGQSVASPGPRPA
ncbi:hypothetical protein Pla175_52140 [Pirellulimonas nuda]|uniref:Glycosyltransferase subfamily 4-like N-terminal domain-containing protein n=1 Tax=Pirellulimonas nuda TaxID=2528009 RepID=A0A518DJY3_9BACT|nr:glycosyltransferase [Pirellulimonas nuda]QDU91783.1 hypothetical protein Pla175_52140 [Pirellulimonas nuda]